MNRKGMVSALIALALIAVGILLLLHTLGILTLSITALFLTYWPVLLILAGLALILRHGILGTLVIAALLALAVYVFLLPFISDGTAAARTVVKEIGLQETDRVDLDLNFGAGDLTLESGSGLYLVKNIVTTTHRTDPEVRAVETDAGVKVTMSRRPAYELGGSIKEDWALALDPNVTFSIDAGYGAAKALFDLRGLRVENLTIGSGATSTDIVFDAYPTLTNIGTGASTFRLYFPYGYPVRLDIDGGAVSKDLNGFVERDGAYYSPGYDARNGSVSVIFDAGAATVQAGFYTEEGAS